MRSLARLRGTWPGHRRWLGSGRRIRWQLLWASLGFAFGAAPAVAQLGGDAFIAPARELTIATVPLAAAAGGGRAPLASLQFSAFGRPFEIHLASNDRLKSRLPPARQAALAGLRLYRGHLPGLPGSWARIADQSGTISGVFWDGVSLFSLSQLGDELIVEQSQDLYDRFLGSFADDIVLPPGGATGPGDAIPSDGATGQDKSGARALTGKLDFPVDPGRTIAVGLVADPSFIAWRDDGTEASLLTTLNVIDGIFLWQLGVELELAELILLETDPFTTDDSEDLLAEFSELKRAMPALASLGLVHLFTGRDITGSDQNTSLLGSAYFGTVCDTVYGVGMTRYRASPNLEAWTAAHELGHNFGAPHDAEPGSDCADAPTGFLMEAISNNSDTFSECSIGEMVPYVAAGPCFASWLPNDLSLRIVEGPDMIGLGQHGDVIVAIDAASLIDAAAVTITVEVSGAVTLERVRERTAQGFICDPGPQPVRCSISYLPVGQTPEFLIELQAKTFGTGAVRVAVDSGNDLNPANNVLNYAISVPATIDIGVEVQMPPEQAADPAGNVFYVSSPVSMTAAVRNYTVNSASDVLATVTFNEQASDWQAATGSGPCAPGSGPHQFVCLLGSLAGNQSAGIALSFRTRASVHESLGVQEDYVQVQVTAAEPEHNGWPNQSGRSVRVTESISDIEIGLDAPPFIVAGEPAEIVIRVENRGPDAARSVKLRTRRLVDANPDVELMALADPAGACTLDDLAREWSCAPSDLAVGQRREIRVSLLAGVAGQHRLSIDGGLIGYALAGYAGDLMGYPLNEQFMLNVVTATPEPEPESEPATGPAPAPSSVVPPQAVNSPAAPSSGSGGGGGGAMDWLLLVLLLVAIRPRPKPQRAQPGFD